MIAVEEFDRDGAALPPAPAAAPVHSPGGPSAVGPSSAQVEDSLDDDDLRTEIELVSDLVVAVSSSDAPLSQPDIDRILGVDPA